MNWVVFRLLFFNFQTQELELEAELFGEPEYPCDNESSGQIVTMNPQVEPVTQNPFSFFPVKYMKQFKGLER